MLRLVHDKIADNYQIDWVNFKFFPTHRYLKKNRSFKFCYMPATSIASSKGIFAVATNNANLTNKGGSTCH